MSKYWILSDSHFGHDKLRKELHRPENFEEVILTNIKELVKPDDILIHLGDFAFYDGDRWAREFCSKCHARSMILVRGNHDKQTNTWFHKRGWNLVVEAFSMKIFGVLVVFTHKPINTLGADIINVHGHLHDCCHEGEFALTENHKLVKMEHNYRPVELRKLIGR